uniref:Uncharacterized protein n=1 Tax=Bartonella rochalimae ATCC BAA-1498 TaxID=685782 RepID=E6YJX6_9HYPH|nr:hypothetical protein BARRO_10097 [Bartonella rochalimae ATCC BAA-1498]
MNRQTLFLNIYALRKIFDLFGGAKRDRTADLLHAMQALSQLSYSPTKNNKHSPQSS